MFSPTTIASSTTMPSTMINANSVIMLTDTPSVGISISAPMNEIGMPIVTQKATRSSRNRPRQIMTSARPM